MSKINKQHFKFIYIEITKKCNLSCIFCPSSKNKSNEYMSITSFKMILEKIKSYTNTIYLHVLGEPLLHPDFCDFVKLAADEDFNVRLTTNGTMLDKYDFNTTRVSKINISLQALINFDRNYIDLYFKKIHNFLESVKTRLNNKSLGIDFRIWNDTNNKKCLELNELINNYLYNIIKISNYPNVHVSISDEFTWPAEGNGENNTKFNCLGGKTHLAILTSGDVNLCCLDYSSKANIGNIFESSLDEILNKDPYQIAMTKMQAGSAFFELCRKCEYCIKFNKE